MKSDQDTDIETLLCDFSDTLLEVQLRNTIERQNKGIRESIVRGAMAVSYTHLTLPTILRV